MTSKRSIFNVKNILYYRQEFESEAPAAEEMLDRVVCGKEQFSFQMRLESGDDSRERFVTRDREFVFWFRFELQMHHDVRGSAKYQCYLLSMCAFLVFISF